jgi:hypothetical protein
VILEKLVAAAVGIEGCRVVVDGVNVICVERDVSVMGGERGAFRFKIHSKEERSWGWRESFGGER